MTVGFIWTIVTKKDSLETRAELAVLRIYVYKIIVSFLFYVKMKTKKDQTVL